MVRLAGRVLPGRGMRVWVPGPDGVPVVAAGTLAPGSPVVVGPGTTDVGVVAAAVADMVALVRLGGVLVAGAGIEVGPGLRTARTEGPSGHRREPVFAALRVLGSADRLGSWPDVLAALFGPVATDGVGLAATGAIRDGRWGVLHLASAASGLLSPEQVEQVLALPGTASPEGSIATLEANLTRVLAKVSPALRLELLADLWSVTRLAALREATGPAEGYRESLNQFVLKLLIPPGEPVRLWRLPTATISHDQWRTLTRRLVADTLAATVLVRAVTAVVRHGPAAGLERVKPLVVAADSALADGLFPGSDPVDHHQSDSSLPGWVLGQLARSLAGASSLEGEALLGDAYVIGRQVYAEAWAILSQLPPAPQPSFDWWRDSLSSWRLAAGYGRSPYRWHHVNLLDRHQLAPLGRRLGLGADPRDEERVGDLLWLADLADALALCHWLPRADLTDGFDGDIFGESLVGHALAVGSVEQAVAEMAQLRVVAQTPVVYEWRGARLVEHPARRWSDLLTHLHVRRRQPNQHRVTRVTPQPYPVPDSLLRLDNSRLPGTDLYIRIARNRQQLDEWPTELRQPLAAGYHDRASRGQSVLIGLYEQNVLIAVLELQRHNPSGRWWGSKVVVWIVAEFEEKFRTAVGAWIRQLPVNPSPNETTPAVAKPALIRRWTLDEFREAGPFDDEYGYDYSYEYEADTDWQPEDDDLLRQEVQEEGHETPPRAPGRSRARPRGTSAAAELGEAMATALASPDVARALAVYSRLAGRDTDSAVTSLRRCGEAGLDARVRAFSDLRTLWQATATRPFITVIHPDGPTHDSLPRSLAWIPSVSRAHGIEVVARHVRRSIARVAPAHELAGCTTDMLCTLILAISANPIVEVTPIDPASAYPLSALDDPDGPWQRASASVQELGVDLDWAALPPLVAPTAWLGTGGWPALWARAHRRA